MTSARRFPGIETDRADLAARRDLTLVAVVVVGLSRLIEPPGVWLVAIFLLLAEGVVDLVRGAVVARRADREVPRTGGPPGLSWAASNGEHPVPTTDRTEPLQADLDPAPPARSKEQT